MTDWRATIEAREDRLDAVRAILCDILQLPVEPDEIDPDAPLFGAGLRLDSIDALELLVRLEARFGVRFPSRDATPGETARTLRSLNTIVDRLLAAEAR